ncbi:phosphoribosylglycinamide formyltransferase [Pseudomonas oryzihabitans]|uniref:phosphoribosylglycinamide formyltransferase n=1 Tax=Pseudomonas oryzihabitans TaxID=47885 RepID=UPI002893CA64|nr:phosphoribosylglycinamide formyltransferase [Pseudomonas oryzihabitans]MDT3720200.1 phosphoribosylglycinamide formyltransferase [Pseudomonas oryzihabitans]
MSSADCAVVVLISGHGSNLQALIDAARPPVRIAAVIANRAEAYGLERARQAGIATAVIDHREHDDRESFDAALAAAIDAQGADLVVLAGFMRILTPTFVRRYQGRLLNIHPSLLPLYKGLHTHQRALEAGDAWHGCSVHFVTEELDGGPVALQSRVPVRIDDTPESLATRVHAAEHLLYPVAVRLYAEGRLRLGTAGAEFDGQAVPPTGANLPELAKASLS